MEMNKNVPNFPTYRGSPFIETPLIEVPLYDEKAINIYVV